MRTLGRLGFALSLMIAALSTTEQASAQSCAEQCSGNIGVGGDVSGYENCMSRCGVQNSSPPHPGPAPPDPCYIAQNAMRPCTKPEKSITGVDSNLVGTWVLPLQQGPWVWVISAKGTYKFHSDAKDGVLPHEGSFSANNGHWQLKATNGYTDKGTYKYQPPDTWIAAGKLGVAAWRRQPAAADSSTTAH